METKEKQRLMIGAIINQFLSPGGSQLRFLDVRFKASFAI